MSGEHTPTAADLPPYARALGIEFVGEEAGNPVLAWAFSVRVQGRPGFLHGGAISGLMEMAAIAALRAELARRGDTPRLKPVNIAVEFLRGGTEQQTFAAGRVMRAGRRVALIAAECWQDDRAKPIALAQLKVLLAPNAE